MVVNSNETVMLTIREVSHILNVHANTLRRWTEQGILKAYRVGPRGDRRFRQEDVVRLFLVDNLASHK
jgi:excisionase family DNA binding protein